MNNRIHIDIKNHFRRYSNLTKPKDQLHPPRFNQKQRESKGNKTTHLRLKFEGAKKVDEEEEIIEQVN